METVLEGFLERSIQISDTKKDWKKGYFVFKRNQHNGSKTLEFFKDSNWKKQEPRGVCNLFSSYTVKIVNDTKKKYMFELITVDKNYQLYTNSESNRQKWVDVLNEGLNLKTYDVVLLDSPPNAYQLVKDIKGTSQMQIGESAVTLLSAGVSSIFWRFATIRRYKSQNGTFILEVGRKSSTGEGIFRFDTVNPVELFEVLDKAVKTRMKSKGIEPTVKPPAHSTVAKVRSNSDQSEALPPPLQMQTEYSHLDSVVQTKHTAMKVEQGNDYATLFAAHDRNVRMRKPETTLLDSKNKPSLIESTTLLTTKSTIPSVLEIDDDQYMEMAGDQQTKPRPPARIKPNAKILSNPIEENTYDKPSAHKTLQTTLSDPNERNTYDALARTTGSPSIGEYDQLFGNKLKFAFPNSSEYNHLDRTPPDNENEKVCTGSQDGDPLSDSQNQSFYDLPKHSAASPSLRKQPPKPIRKAPTAPLSRIVSPSSPNSNAILKLQRNLEVSGFNPNRAKPIMVQRDIRVQPVYDCPNPELPVYEGYNMVGDVIPGEYKEDADGYVKIPTDENSESIYQTPRGEAVV